MTEQKNPAPWTSFESFGAAYALRGTKRILELSVPATYIQRWWRLRLGKTGGRKLYPIELAGRLKTVRESAAYLRGEDPFLSQEFRAFEKLDGTNFGTRCDGALFGRRFQVYGESYQTVPLVGAIPRDSQVSSIKRAMLGDAADDAKLIVYGELMCNPRKFDYTERAMGHKFYCFGATITTSEENYPNLLAQLHEKGFVACMSSGDHIRVNMNTIFGDLVKGNGVTSVPMLDEGPLRSLCFRLKETLMKDGMEGVVLTNDKGTMLKWKTSVEDESKSHQALSSLLSDNAPRILEHVGVDIAFVQCLIDVAQKKEKVGTRIGAKGKAKREPPNAIYDDETIQLALASAMSKYDAPESYFAKEEMATILGHLKTELVEDLGASTDKEIKFVEKAVRKEVGAAFGKWKRQQAL